MFLCGLLSKPLPVAKMMLNMFGLLFIYFVPCYRNFRAVIDPAIQRNAYFAHPENLLLTMAFDEQDHVRQLAPRQILKARQQQITDVRKFVIPQINFEAADYIELISWIDVDVTEPPLLSQIPTNEISGRIFETNDALLPLINVPCHTQALERHVKLVTEASQSVCVERARN